MAKNSFVRKFKDNVNEKKVESIRQMVTDAVTSDPDHIAYMFKKNGEVISVTNKEFYSSVENLGAALTKLGHGKTHIACVGENSYNWIITYFTVLMSAGVFVPLDKELPIESLFFLINESDTEVVFCDKKFVDPFKSIIDKLTNIKMFVVFGLEEDDGIFVSFDKLVKSGEELDKAQYDALKSDEYELKDLVFTSGTTGVAKGVMLTEHNLCSGVYYGMQVSQITDRGLSVLPYNHTYEAVCDILVAVNSHATLCINDSIRHVQENLKLFHPSYIYLVPAFSEYFYNTIMKNIKKQGKEKSFEKAMNISDSLLKVGIDMRRVFFKDIHAAFGGKLVKIVCGGAPIRPEIGEFFNRIGISLTGGYGITECSPLVSVNDDGDNNFGSAGHRLPCLEWKIENAVEGIGEICVKGDVVMKGYYKRPDLTAEALADGWFHTGDYGYINEKDEIVITGRKKNIIVLNNGKNIYPEEIEGYISRIDGVNEVIVSGIKNDFGQDTGLKAEIYSEKGRSADELMPEIRDALSELPSYKHINSVEMRTDPFPKTTTNKIKRT